MVCTCWGFGRTPFWKVQRRGFSRTKNQDAGDDTNKENQGNEETCCSFIVVAERISNSTTVEWVAPSSSKQSTQLMQTRFRQLVRSQCGCTTNRTVVVDDPKIVNIFIVKTLTCVQFPTFFQFKRQLAHITSISSVDGNLSRWPKVQHREGFWMLVRSIHHGLEQRDEPCRRLVQSNSVVYGHRS